MIMRHAAIIAAVALWPALLSAAPASGAPASGPHDSGHHQQAHPRRQQVNGRLGDQARRERQGLAKGLISQGQYNQLRAGDRRISAEERAFASQDGGHITHGDEAYLNRQENANSARIYNEKTYGMPHAPIFASGPNLPGGQGGYAGPPPSHGPNLPGGQGGYAGGAN